MKIIQTLNPKNKSGPNKDFRLRLVEGSTGPISIAVNKAIREITIMKDRVLLG